MIWAISIGRGISDVSLKKKDRLRLLRRRPRDDARPDELRDVRRLGAGDVLRVGRFAKIVLKS
jgi:hypothetical protein